MNHKTTKSLAAALAAAATLALITGCGQKGALKPAAPASAASAPAR